MDLPNPIFSSALHDYTYLLNRKYPEKGIMKLVGDRYKLTRTERTLLYRGAATEKQIEDRKKRLVNPPVSILVVDGYNVLFTLYNYRLGHQVFISTDMLCRDAGALFGKILHPEIFVECLQIFTEYLQLIKCEKLIIYLDDSVKNNELHAGEINTRLHKSKQNLSVRIVNSADEAILEHAEGVFATSDSGILDMSTLPIVDIPRNLIESRFHSKLINLASF
jgi:hypothetical protein